MSHVFARNIAAPPRQAARAQGCYIYDDEGRAWLDGSGGAAVSCLGHGDAEVLAAIKAQLDTLAFAHTGFFTSAPAEALAERLAQAAPGGLDRVWFVSGGSEAVESALKLARQYFLERGEPERRHVMARRQSYHGNTLGALAAGGNQWRRAPYEPMLAPVSHIAPAYEYAERAKGESLEAYGRRAADELEREILALGPETVMAFVAEPVVGATLGAVPAPPGYFARIREICDRYGVLLILDEVMCGMGRTGTLFAHEAEGIEADIVTIAKGLGAGYQPIGAMIASAEIHDAIGRGSGFFQHGHTYMGHPAACAAGLAVLEAIESRDLLAQVRARGETLARALGEAFGQHPHVGDIRGRGLFQGIELVEDRAARTPFAPERRVAARLKQAALEAGLICYPMGGTRDGRVGDHVLLAPPFIITEAQIGELVEKLALALDRALEAARSESP